MNTLQHLEHQVSALNDLIKINNDRIAGYKKHMDATIDDDLDALFAGSVYQSRRNVSELTSYVTRLGGNTNSSNTLAGKFYHSWMDIRSAIIRQNRNALIDFCELSEEVVMRAYYKALNDQELVWNDRKIMLMLMRQLNGLNDSYEQVKQIRGQSIAS